MASKSIEREGRTFDIAELPSVKEDGMSVAEEATKRKKTCRFIEEACRILKLPRLATSTAMVFFHRFYAKHSFGKHDRFEVAVACILLAAKTEESPRKIHHVLEESVKLRSRAAAAGRISSQGTSPTTTTTSSDAALDPKSEEFTKLKERVLLLERVILHTIGFELSVNHPFKYIVDYIKLMIQRRQIEYIEPKPDLNPQKLRDTLLNEVVQYSLNFANDSHQTSLCIQFPAEEIARACVFLGGQFAKTKADWKAALAVTNVEAFATICVQLLELVTEKKGGDKAAFRAMRAELEGLRSANKNKNPPTSSNSASSQPSPKRARTME